MASTIAAFPAQPSLSNDFVSEVVAGSVKLITATFARFATATTARARALPAVAAACGSAFDAKAKVPADGAPARARRARRLATLAELMPRARVARVPVGVTAPVPASLAGGNIEIDLAAAPAGAAPAGAAPAGAAPAGAAPAGAAPAGAAPAEPRAAPSVACKPAVAFAIADAIIGGALRWAVARHAAGASPGDLLADLRADAAGGAALRGAEAFVAAHGAALALDPSYYGADVALIAKVGNGTWAVVGAGVDALARLALDVTKAIAVSRGAESAVTGFAKFGAEDVRATFASAWATGSLDDAGFGALLAAVDAGAAAWVAWGESAKRAKAAIRIATAAAAGTAAVAPGIAVVAPGLAAGTATGTATGTPAPGTAAGTPASALTLTPGTTVSGTTVLAAAPAAAAPAARRPGRPKKIVAGEK
jgi:hypothetical protein